MPFIFREAVRSVRRTPGIWVMNVLTLAVALGLSGLFGILAWRTHTAMESLRENLVVEAYFSPAISSEQAAAAVRDNIASISSVRSSQFISREQALKDYDRQSGEDVESVLGMNPLPASVQLRLRSPSAAHVKSLMGVLRSMPGIADVRSDLALAETMETRSAAFDTIAIVIGALLLVSALCFSIVTARFMLHSRRETTRTLSLLGAARGDIIGPLLLETAASGLLGGLCAIVILDALRHTVFTGLGGLSAPAAPNDISLVAALLALSGIGLSLIGSISGWWMRGRE